MSLTMNKNTKLVNKVKHLLRKTNAPRYLHHFGPKIYELWQHVFSLFVKEYCQLSYRRTTNLLRGLGFKVGTKSTLQRYAVKLKLAFWRKMFNLTINVVDDIMALDGTGLEKSRASEHYIRRITTRDYGFGFHLSLLSDMNGQIISLRLRKKYSHDTKDVKYLYKQALKKPKAC